MTDNTELKRLVDRVLKDRRFCGDENHKALADGVRALIAENERLNAENKQLIQLECYGGSAQAAINLLAERDQLKAENEALCKSLEGLIHISNATNWEQHTCGEIGKARKLLAAMGKGEQS